MTCWRRFNNKHLLLNEKMYRTRKIATIKILIYTNLLIYVPKNLTRWPWPLTYDLENNNISWRSISPISNHISRISQSIEIYPCYASLDLEILRQFTMRFVITTPPTCLMRCLWNLVYCENLIWRCKMNYDHPKAHYFRKFT
jgi:hypothetical protein